MTESVSFFASVHNDILNVEALIRSQANGYHPDLKAAVDLILNSGGKRIRPALILLTGKMLKAPLQRLYYLAAAIELLHTATLVHDDLIDNSLLRRGMPTLNSQWSPGATVLTGDFLFACAAKLAADTESIAVMKLFSNMLTVIVNGEINQLFSGHYRISREEYFNRIYAKTASLFETAAWTAALLGAGDEGVVNNMRCFGFEIGMAFQITDDILDFTGEQAAIGKPVGSDLRQGLITLPSLHYIESHPEDPDVRCLLAGNWDQDENQIRRLIESIRQSNAIENAHQEAREHVKRGLECLHRQPPSSERHSLEELACFIIQRHR